VLWQCVWEMGKWKANKMSIVLVSCMLIMLLTFSVLLEFTFSWLYTSVSKQDAGNASLGSVSGSLTTTNTDTSDFAVTMPSEGSTIALSDYSKITNTGNTSALLRVFYSITIDQSKKQIATTNDFSSLLLHNNFLPSDENIPNTFSGYYYYNAPLEAGATVSLINSAIPTNTIAEKTVKINMMAEFVNYTGGPYEIGQMLPWDNIPHAWFVNVEGLLVTGENTISPKIEFAASEVKKMELTAKVDMDDSGSVFLFGGNFGIHILSGNANWGAGSLINLQSSLTPVQFANGKFNTATFTWDSCSGTLGYICISTLCENVTFKQIRIWNTSGELIYDLRPHTSGKFLNAVTNEIMPMYDFSSNTPVESAEVYEYIGFEAYNYDFENGEVVFHNCAGFAFSNVTEDSHNGGRSLKITGTGMDSIPQHASTNPQPPGVLKEIQNLKTGYKYKLSCWYKSDAPKGAMGYIYDKNGKLWSYQPSFAVQVYNGSSYINKPVSVYSYSGDWEMLVVEIDVQSVDFTVYLNISAFNDESINTYIDDVKIVRMPC